MQNSCAFPEIPVTGAQSQSKNAKGRVAAPREAAEVATGRAAGSARPTASLGTPAPSRGLRAPERGVRPLGKPALPSDPGPDLARLRPAPPPPTCGGRRPPGPPDCAAGSAGRGSAARGPCCQLRAHLPLSPRTASPPTAASGARVSDWPACGGGRKGWGRRAGLARSGAPGAVTRRAGPGDVVITMARRRRGPRALGGWASRLLKSEVGSGSCVGRRGPR